MFIKCISTVHQLYSKGAGSIEDLHRWMVTALIAQQDSKAIGLRSVGGFGGGAEGGY